jgi:alpha-1,3-rhamnosyl/mannosyltransferase
MARLGIGDRVRRIGYLEHRSLPAIYSGADAFLFPTHYEGFGLPLLEAMACRCPVVAARNSSTPEVTGGAAVLEPAQDADALAEGLLRVLEDEAFRRDLVERAAAHAAGFSWRRCAEQTLGVYRSLT